MVALPVLEGIFQGFNGSILAYGQTGSGKTHTMQGSMVKPELKGIIPRLFDNIFEHIEAAGDNMVFTVKISMMEIYMEEIQDLLVVGNRVKIREAADGSPFLENCEETSVSKVEDMSNVYLAGQENRKVAKTDMNAQSSRSHMIAIINITQENTDEAVTKKGKLYLVDLAGSERVGKTNAVGKVLDEGKLINKSLFNLGSVINALTDGLPHVPYRNSKLTRLLQDCFGGNSKTTLIITCSPVLFNEQETISSLKFGIRAKTIKNKVTQNAELSREQLMKLLEEEKTKSTRLEAHIAFLQAHIKNALKAAVPEFKSSVAEKTPAEAAKPVIAAAITGLVSSPEMEEKLRNMEARFKEMEEQLRAANEGSTALEARIAELRDVNAALTKSVAAEQQNAVRLSDRILEIEAEKNSLRNSLESLSSMNTKIEETASGKVALLRSAL